MRKRAKIVNISLFICCAFASALAYFQFAYPPERENLQSDTSAGRQFSGELALQLPTPKNEKIYSAINLKPIFFESRSPRKMEAKTQEKVILTQKPKLQILGIITTDGKESVLVKLDKKQDTYILSVGETILGWNISEIYGDHIILELQGERERYSITNFSPLEKRKFRSSEKGVNDGRQIINIKP